MLISRECDYALRIIRQLSNYEMRAAGTMCDNESVPVKFAYRILKRLEDASIVKSYRGKNGGYKLVVGLSTITLYDIIKVMGGDLVINGCLKQGADCPNHSNEKKCMIHEELTRVQELFDKALKERSIEDILKKKSHR